MDSRLKTKIGKTAFERYKRDSKCAHHKENYIKYYYFKIENFNSPKYIIKRIKR